MERLIKIGFWRSSKDDDVQLPWPEDYIKNGGWEELSRGCMSPEELKKIVLEYLNSFEEINHYRGISICRICGIANGCCERTDGEFLWPIGYSHYVEIHNVLPPTQIIGKAIKYFLLNNEYFRKNFKGIYKKWMKNSPEMREKIRNFRKEKHNEEFLKKIEELKKKWGGVKDDK